MNSIFNAQQWMQQWSSQYKIHHRNWKEASKFGERMCKGKLPEAVFLERIA